MFKLLYHFRLTDMAPEDKRNPVPDYCDGCVDWDAIIRYASNMALAKAAKKGCLGCVNTAIAAGADVNITVESTGNAAVVEAAKEGHFRLCNCACTGRSRCGQTR